LVTNQKNIALIILTADCVPVIIHDPRSQAIGIVHAGWKGSYLGVLEETLLLMQKVYGSNVQDLVCEFGPSAKSCCYEVSKEFQDDFEKKHAISHLFFETRDFKIYFDNSLFLQEMLKKFGILTQNIYTSNALCTICNPRFCSFRKDKEHALRQITLVALR
jgi:polyphenol oxidase